MWIFTEFGILMPSLRPAHTITDSDNRLMQIRTRRRFELDYLREHYMPTTLGETIFLGNADYQYRAYCEIDDWAAAMHKLSMEIDYTKFKPTTDRHPGGGKLHDLYNTVWSRVLGAFPAGSSYSKTTPVVVKNYRAQLKWWEDADLYLCAKEVDRGFCGKVDGHRGKCKRNLLREG